MKRINNKNGYCNWIYRSGTNNSHWADISCIRKLVYLSKVKECEPFEGCADTYNGRICQSCNRIIKVIY